MGRESATTIDRPPRAAIAGKPYDSDSGFTLSWRRGPQHNRSQEGRRSLSTHLLRCARTPLPIALASFPTTQAAAIPDAEDIDNLLAVLASDCSPRLIIVGRDPMLAAVLTHLLRHERLGLELGYVPPEPTPASRAYRLASGNAGAKRTLEGTVRQVPLVRDDTGTVLVGRAEITGPDGTFLDGEAYVDEVPVLRGQTKSLVVTPSVELPGLCAATARRFGKLRWVKGRAMQLGTAEAVITRDGVRATRSVPRVSFYRHHEPWLLVR